MPRLWARSGGGGDPLGPWMLTFEGVRHSDESSLWSDRGRHIAMSDLIRVLLIDDETLYVESLAKVLRRRGMEVFTAPNGEQGVALLSTEECDVIVLDLRMPGMDGIATLEAIRRRDTLTPVFC